MMPLLKRVGLQLYPVLVCLHNEIPAALSNSQLIHLIFLPPSHASLMALKCVLYHAWANRYDIMLDDELRPWLLEVNHSPSFCIDSPLDQAIKEQLIMDTIELVCFCLKSSELCNLVVTTHSCLSFNSTWGFKASVRQCWLPIPVTELWLSSCQLLVSCILDQRHEAHGAALVLLWNEI